MPRTLPANTTIGVFGAATGVVDKSGNPVTVYTDYACWVEATQSFVNPEDCNLMQKTDE